MDKLSSPVLLLVEGEDEKIICELLLRRIAPNFSLNLDLKAASGGSDLLSKAQALDVLPGFQNLTQLAIICDAEEIPQKTAKQWSAFKATFETQYPNKKCNILILPSEEQAGAIDSVFLNSLDPANNPVAACALDFAACVGAQGSQTTQARRDKLALTSYINAHTKNPYSRVGFAVTQGAKDLFDFDHPSFAPLTNFLKKLLN
jgi:hypothetical protein